MEIRLSLPEGAERAYIMRQMVAGRKPRSARSVVLSLITEATARDKKRMARLAQAAQVAVIFACMMLACCQRPPPEAPEARLTPSLPRDTVPVFWLCIPLDNTPVIKP